MKRTGVVTTTSSPQQTPLHYVVRVCTCMHMYFLACYSSPHPSPLSNFSAGLDICIWSGAPFDVVNNLPLDFFLFFFNTLHVYLSKRAPCERWTGLEAFACLPGDNPMAIKIKAHRLGDPRMKIPLLPSPPPPIGAEKVSFHLRSMCLAKGRKKKKQRSSFHRALLRFAACWCVGAAQMSVLGRRTRPEDGYN